MRRSRQKKAGLPARLAAIWHYGVDAASAIAIAVALNGILWPTLDDDDNDEDDDYHYDNTTTTTTDTNTHTTVISSRATTNRAERLWAGATREAVVFCCLRLLFA